MGSSIRASVLAICTGLKPCSKWISTLFHSALSAFSFRSQRALPANTRALRSAATQRYPPAIAPLRGFLCQPLRRISRVTVERARFNTDAIEDGLRPARNSTSIIARSIPSRCWYLIAICNLLLFPILLHLVLESAHPRPWPAFGEMWELADAGVRVPVAPEKFRSESS